jgi:hypothetical protein
MALVLKGSGIRSNAGIFRHSAIRQPAGAVQAIRAPLQEFDKRAADAY